MSNKELSDLDICRALAEINQYAMPATNLSAGVSEEDYYNKHSNPITDNALNLELRDEYEIKIIYDKNYLYMYDKECNLFSAKFADKSQINRAVCECILESVK